MTAQRRGAFALILLGSLAAVAALRLALPPSSDAVLVSLASPISVMTREDARLNRACDDAPFWVGLAGMTSEIDAPPRVCADAKGPRS